MRRHIGKLLLPVLLVFAGLSVAASDANSVLKAAYDAMRDGKLKDAEQSAQSAIEILEKQKDSVSLARAFILYADIEKWKAAGISRLDPAKRDAEFDKVMTTEGPPQATTFLDKAEKVLLDAVPEQKGKQKGFALTSIYYQLTQVYARKPDKERLCSSYTKLLESSEIAERDNPDTKVNLFGRAATPQQFRQFWRKQSERVGCGALN